MRPSLRHRGLSIVELMVSVAISVSVLSALTYVYVGSRAAYRTNEALARVQETGRFAIEWIARDLRAAGYMGCLSRATTLEVYTKSGAGAVPFGAGVWGFEDGAGFSRTGSTPPSNPTSIDHVRGDVLVISRLIETDPVVRVVEQDAKNANIKVTSGGSQFKEGEDLLVTDCQRAALFRATNVSGGNCNIGGGPFGCITIVHSSVGNDPHLLSSFSRDGRAFVARYSRAGYFIGNNRGGRPSLYRFESTGTGGASRTEEVAENIEDIDFLFGVDTANNDNAVDAYLTAAEVTAGGLWDRVVSVRASLVAVSSEVAAAPQRQAVMLRDSNNDAVVDLAPARGEGDRRLRQTFSTTVALRNRLP